MNELIVTPSYTPKTVRILIRSYATRPDTNACRKVTYKSGRYFRTSNDDVRKAYYILESLYNKEKKINDQIERFKRTIKGRNLFRAICRNIPFNLYHSMDVENDIKMAIDQLRETYNDDRGRTEATVIKYTLNNNSHNAQRQKLIKYLVYYAKHNHIPFFELIFLNSYFGPNTTYYEHGSDTRFFSDTELLEEIRHLGELELLKVSRFVSYGEEKVGKYGVIEYMVVREPVVAYLKHKSYEHANIVQQLFVQQGATHDYDAYMTMEARRFASMNPDDILADLQKPKNQNCGPGKGWHRQSYAHRKAAKIGHIRRKYK